MLHTRRYDVERMKRKLKIMTIVFLFVGIGLVLAVCIFMNQTQFGKNPDRVYFEVARNSPHFVNGEFRNIHMMPEETAQAVVEIDAKALLPAHSGKFAISNHAWKDPFIRLARASYDKPYKLLTPVIGEPVYLEDEKQIFSHWWEKYE